MQIRVQRETTAKGLAERNDERISQGAHATHDLLNNKVNLREDRTAVSGAAENHRKGMATRNVTETSQSATFIPDLLNHKSGRPFEDDTALGAVRDLRKFLEILKNATEFKPNYEYFDLDDPSDGLMRNVAQEHRDGSARRMAQEGRDGWPENHGKM